MSTWSYSGDPSSSKLDAVRFLVQDTNPQDKQLFNEELNYLISQFPNPYRAAGQAAQRLAAKYARMIDKSVGDLRLAYSQRQKAYHELATELLNTAALRTSLPYAGGIRVSDKQIDKLDPDMVQPKFTINEFDFPGSIANQPIDPSQSGISNQ